MHATRNLLDAADTHDVADSTATIRRSVASVAGGTIVKETKTHAARRIAVDAETLDGLERRRERAQQLAEACRHPFDPDGFVFTSEPGGSRPLHADTISGGFQQLCRRAGLNGVRLDDLRHLHEPNCSQPGCPCGRVRPPPRGERPAAT